MAEPHFDDFLIMGLIPHRHRKLSGLMQVNYWASKYVLVQVLDSGNKKMKKTVSAFKTSPPMGGKGEGRTTGQYDTHNN